MSQSNATARQNRWRFVWKCFAGLGLLYLLLLVPEPPSPRPTGAGRHPFVWGRDALWSALEARMHAARDGSAPSPSPEIGHRLAAIQSTLALLAATNAPPSSPLFDELETNVFELAPLVAASPEQFSNYVHSCLALRSAAKRQSEHWPMDAGAARDRLYRLLYGSRAALEEVMLQLPREQVPALALGDDEPSAAPSAVVRGVTIHSGDILVSRAGAPTSALIARGNDYAGNFSHVALACVDERTKQVCVIESHIERGVVISPIETYLADTKLRIMALRLRADLSALVADPLLPHKAATQALRAATSRHIPYDFTMDYRDSSKQFCSEVAASAYQPFGVKLWMGLSHISSSGVTAWLAALGARHFETQEPSDLEYDPQLRVVAEWRDPETLFKDHADNAVIDAMLEAAERGETLNYNPWMLPVARLAKTWSVVENWFGAVGPIPEGMTAATALRVQRLKSNHTAIKTRLMEKAERFQRERGYAPPYWELVTMAREAKKELAGNP